MEALPLRLIISPLPLTTTSIQQSSKMQLISVTYVLVLLPGILALPVGLGIGNNDPIGHGEAGPPPWRRDAAGTQIASIFSGTDSPGHSFPLLPRAPLGQAPPWEQDGSSLNPDPPTWKQEDAEQGLSPPWIRSTSESTIEAAPLSKQVDSTPNPDPPTWKREGAEQCPEPSPRWTRCTSGDTSEVVPLLKRDDFTLNPDPPTWKRRAAERSTTLPEARSTCESASKVDLSTARNQVTTSAFCWEQVDSTVDAGPLSWTGSVAVERDVSGPPTWIDRHAESASNVAPYWQQGMTEDHLPLDRGKDSTTDMLELPRGVSLSLSLKA
ncbi:hypothetical protein EV360DRAFT_84998 [Lentinula raphanica]|nr:hypothetical protein EV360DRAFT_84998 [Lentinula raphanica]